MSQQANDDLKVKINNPSAAIRNNLIKDSDAALVNDHTRSFTTHGNMRLIEKVGRSHGHDARRKRKSKNKEKKTGWVPRTARSATRGVANTVKRVSGATIDKITDDR